MKNIFASNINMAFRMSKFVAEGLVKGNAHGGGEIERANITGHGYEKIRPLIAGQDVRRQSSGFRSKYKEHPVKRLHVPKGAGAAFGEQKDFIFPGRHGSREIVEMVPGADIDMLPVIQSGALNLPAF